MPHVCVYHLRRNGVSRAPSQGPVSSIPLTLRMVKRSTCAESHFLYNILATCQFCVHLVHKGRKLGLPTVRQVAYRVCGSPRPRIKAGQTSQWLDEFSSVCPNPV